MSRCPPCCCSGCRDKAQEERIAWKAKIQWTEAVSDGPVPELHMDSKEEEPKEVEDQSNQEIVSSQLALFQHQRRSKPLPVFLTT